MIIGIDAHSLEGKRTGVGRYLVNLLVQWDKLEQKDIKFILYFKKEIPQDLSLTKDFFKKRILEAPANLQSNALFIHYLLPQAAKKDKIDILFCPSYIGPINYKGQMALTLHDIIYQARPKLYNWPSPMDKILLKYVSRKSAQKARVIFTPSEFSREEVIKHYQIDPAKILVTFEAADDSFKQIVDKEKLDQIKEKYQIQDKFIFYVGSIFNRRHVFETICAFQKIAPELPQYQFLVVGSNHTQPWIDMDRLVEAVNQDLNREAILRKDYLTGPDLVALYNAADLFVWLSDYEGFGLPVLESMACGTPVVTSHKTSLIEVADEAAIFVRDTKSTDEIAEAIYQGLTNEELHQDLKVKGLENAKRFSWPKCAQKTLEALLNL